MELQSVSMDVFIVDISKQKVHRTFGPSCTQIEAICDHSVGDFELNYLKHRVTFLVHSIEINPFRG